MLYQAKKLPLRLSDEAVNLSENLFFGKLWVLRKEAEWRFLRPKAYKGTSMGEKTSNKRNNVY